MEGLKKLRKRNIVLIVLAMLLLLAAVSSALAFITRTGEVKNRITYGNVELELIENTIENGVEIPFTQAEPVRVTGGEYSRIVRVKNTGKHPTYVRLALYLTAADDSGKEQVLPTDFYSFDINDTDWTESEGWYYYTPEALTENEETTALITKIMFDHTKLNEVSGWNITLHIRADAVQSENNGDTVWEADGWPADQGGVTP